jgi:antagonist of KipI
MAEGGEGQGLRVISAGLLMTVQDLGRYGYGRFGLPVCGAVDDYALRWANLLVGNEPGAAALEITLLGPTLRLESRWPALAALTGADFEAVLDGVSIAPWRSFIWQPGETLEMGSSDRGVRAYLAVAGGIDIPVVLGSRATDLLGAIGGVNGRALQPGDILPLASTDANSGHPWMLPTHVIPHYEDDVTVCVVLGPQEERFTAEAANAFLSAAYAVTPQSDRMGIRLEGPRLMFRDGPAGADILSEGVVTGAIQVPGHGQPIVLLAGRQTTGGYAKVATVISADLWRLGQLGPGNRVRFQAISLAEAYEARRAYLSSFDPAVLQRMNVGTAACQHDVAALVDIVTAHRLAELCIETPALRLRLRRTMH